jgi:hypothetical protein
MTKSLKIFLSILALIVSVFCALILSGQLDLSFFQSQIKNEENTTGAGEFTDILEKAPEGFTIDLPVDKKYLDLVFFNEVSPQSYSFLLDSGEPIKAVFSGKITKIFRGQKPSPEAEYFFEEIRLENSDGNFQASYYLLGDILVKEGDSIEVGAILAKAKGISSNLEIGINFTFSLYNKEGKIIRLSKEIFRF